ncbi:MAG: tRNA (adenosine(37)-N6)-threonylcarbamoyltransferase complex ATPase subunit type 1 TsaE [SAR86 cluster bacterium]|jgi:tRNA threonylcarbamoyladenosine biosynthesis protein TsaE|uniref:tRNA threonylcarbamoyladenosine biosynthesis protein TsaE n=1 Tax=SAR86 cluster bacterium TaxID=2030880 RepID=A0A972VVG9_9GAMM|nr:tRNA (adenosine(37)-N6)-threonylcarbamoyltransferase complex ATPase subunit type 1 TsaE [SAR86 cluster bacterium]|tara:strand:+ start:38434 stop:38904 length:471 start_codon:yes stop_codon:yes gene_type:complete
MTVFAQQLADELATEAMGRRLSVLLNGRGIVYLSGELGAGKTTLSRGILRGMGYTGAVKSPTFTLVEPYEMAEQAAYHFDLYRLEDPEEFEYLGIDEYLESGHLCLLEWPEKGLGHIPRSDLTIDLEVLAEGRLLVVTANSAFGEQICHGLIESAK